MKVVECIDQSTQLCSSARHDNVSCVGVGHGLVRTALALRGFVLFRLRKRAGHRLSASEFGAVDI